MRSNLWEAIERLTKKERDGVAVSKPAQVGGVERRGEKLFQICGVLWRPVYPRNDAAGNHGRGHE